MSQMLAFFILMAILYIGDVVSNRTKAWVSSVFVCAVLFIIGYWTFFPKDIVSRAGLPPVVAVLLMHLLVTNMGTLLSFKELVKQWKTIVIALMGIVGIVVFGFYLGSFIFDVKTILIAIPPLVGGIVSALMMSSGASALGLEELAVFAVVLYVVQGFAGYPLTSIALKREGKRVLKLFNNNQWETETKLISPIENKAIDEVTASQNNKPRLFQWLPDQYQTTYFHFLRVAVVAFLAYMVSTLCEPYFKINALILCLLFGVIATSLGFLEKQPLKKANGFGFAIMGLMLFVFQGLNHATPDMLLKLIYPLVVFILLAVAGMYIFSAAIGRVLGVTKEMAFAVSLTALYGFPADYIITHEVVNALTKDKKEQEVLMAHMLPPMLVGGFISVTIVSVILAGVFVNLLPKYM